MHLDGNYEAIKCAKGKRHFRRYLPQLDVTRQDILQQLHTSDAVSFRAKTTAADYRHTAVSLVAS